LEKLEEFKMAKRKGVRRDAQEIATYQERKLAEEHDRFFLGSARVDMDALQFVEPCFREFDEKNLERLLDAYEREGCFRMESGYHIPATIDQQALSSALVAAHSSTDALLCRDSSRWPKLTFPREFRLHCLHGRHRIEAGRRYLSSYDRWWIVDLYANGKPPRCISYFC
jgi:hypothetical protein